MKKNTTLMKEYSEWLFEEDRSSIIYEKKSPTNISEDISLVRTGLRTAVQYGIAAALEYGSIATIAGAPAGPVAETIVDGIFALDSVRQAINSLSGIRQNLRKGGNIVEQVTSMAPTAIRNGWSSFYEVIKGIWRNLKHFVGEHLENLDQVVEEIKEEIEGFLTQISEAISDAIKVVIPDATLSLAAGEGIKYVITHLSENPYSALTSLMSRFSMLDNFIRSPETASETFQTIYRTLIDALDNLKSDISNPDASIRQRLVRFGIGTYVAGPLAGAALASNYGGSLTASGLERAINFFNEKEPEMLQLIQNILTVLLPTVFGLLASVQILMKGEWRGGEEQEEESENTSSKAEPDEETPAVNSRESAALNEHIVYSDIRLKKLAGLID